MRKSFSTSPNEARLTKKYLDYQPLSPALTPITRAVLCDFNWVRNRPDPEVLSLLEYMKSSRSIGMWCLAATSFTTFKTLHACDINYPGERLKCFKRDCTKGVKGKVWPMWK